MSETNEAKKEPGQVLFELIFPGMPWIGSGCVHSQWAATEKRVTDHYAHRLATLEAGIAHLHSENVDPHRQNSALRVDVCARRNEYTAAESQLRVLRSRHVENLHAAVVQFIESAAKGNTAEQRDEALKRAADLDAEVIALRARVEAMMHGSEALERERDEARDGWQRVQNELVGARAEVANLKAQALVRGQRSRYECVTPAGTLYLDDPDANSVQFREAVRYAFASISPRPAAGPEDRVAAGEAIRKFEDGETSAGELRDELQLPEAPAPVERKPPFRDWTDEDRAKLVPGASVVWFVGDALAESTWVTVMTRPVERCGTWMLRARTRGEVVIVGLRDCDPATIEPPATQAKRPACPSEECPACSGEACFRCGAGMGGAIEGRPPCEHDHDERHPRPAKPATQAAPVERPPAPDLRPGDRVATMEGHARSITAPPAWVKGEWLVECDGGTIMRCAAFDLTTRARPGERPSAPDLRPGDRVTACDPRFGRPSRILVRSKPTWTGGAWHVQGEDMEIREIGRVGTVPVAWCDLSTRERPFERPPAPDLRAGDVITAQRPGSARRGRGVVTSAPVQQDGVWHVTCESLDLGGDNIEGTIPVAWIDLTSRVRTWHPGEVVPHAPGKFKLTRRPDGPLAEPWTQTGI